MATFRTEMTASHLALETEMPHFTVRHSVRNQIRHGRNSKDAPVGEPIRDYRQSNYCVVETFTRPFGPFDLTERLMRLTC